MAENIEDERGQVHGRMLAYKKIMRLAMEVNDISRKQLAIALKTDQGTVTRYLDDPYPQTLPIHGLQAWRRETGDLALLRQIADDHGFALVPNGDGRVKVNPARLLPLLSKSFGAQIGAEIEHLSDGIYSESEIAEDISGWTKVKHLVEAHLDGLMSQQRRSA